MKIILSDCILVVDLMAPRVQHTTKIECYSGIRRTSQYQQINPRNLQKKEDRFNKFYNSYGEPGPFFDMEDLEYTQFFD